MNHLGIYCTNSIDKKKLIQAIQDNTLLKDYFDLNGLKGQIYSSITIDALIEEEYKHGKVVVTSKANSTLEEMSSGQQRMALAEYIFKQMPTYVILDDIQGNIDSDNLSHLRQLLDSHSHACLFIQIFSRIDDVLPYLSKIIKIDNFLNIVGVVSLQEFQSAEISASETSHFNLPQFSSEIKFQDPIVKMENVSVSYDSKTILNKINWTINAGEFWELRGPVGSGKSTLLSMIIGDNPKAFGQDIYLFGRKKGSGESVWDIKKNIGYFYPKMMQLFSKETSIENMIVSGFYDSIGLYVHPKDSYCAIAKEWLEILGPDYKMKKFQNLSPGQQRIVLVIRAIVKQPPLLILDEPTVGLDEYNIQLFLLMVQKIAITEKIAIVFVSHRNEVGLHANYTIELIPTENGSISKVSENKKQEL